jgi:hypothetical protein
LELGAIETTGNNTGSNTGTTVNYNGEPTESGFIYNLEGSVGYRDRSLGGKFVLVGGGRRKLEAPGTMSASIGKTTATVDTTDTKLAAMNQHEAKQKAIAKALMKEKGRFKMESRRLGLKPSSSLATQISKGEVGSSGIGKLSMLGPAKMTIKRE